jgi:hypothetical protein
LLKKDDFLAGPKAAPVLAPSKQAADQRGQSGSGPQPRSLFGEKLRGALTKGQGDEQ